MTRMIPVAILLGLLGLLGSLAVPATLTAQDAFWPGTSYDTSVPTMEAILGHAPGADIVSHAEIARYLDALVAARPNQIQVHEYARTWEGRSLVYAVVGSEANVARIDTIKADMRKLSDPRQTTEDEAQQILETQPAITWLAYGVHGNEISSPDAALFTAYHLLAAENDPVVEQILSETLVVLVPTQNADGRDRFVNHFRVSRGITPRAHPAAAEHDEPWPGGRTNHYYFDLNRDWLALTQPETRGHVRAFLEWFPTTFVDLHEMGGNASYYFTPEAVPYNPHITSSQREVLDVYGRNNAKWFDTYGFLYFTREVFDAFYPGYGASWPIFHGTNAATYEQASARGLVYRREDGTDLHFSDGVRHHFVASIATAETTATHRRRMLDGFWTYRKTAVEEGRSEAIKAFAVANDRDSAAVDKLAGILTEHGIDVMRTRQPFAGCGGEFAAGSLVIDLAQPTKRLIRTILDEQVDMEDEFLAEQERRRKKNLSDEIYDVTGWSLAQMFNLSSSTCDAVPTGDFVKAGTERVMPKEITGGRAQLAYLVPWGNAAAGRLLTRALLAELKVLSADKTIQQGGRTYPAGTLIFMVDHNPESIHDTMAELARTTGAEVIATGTGWVEGGVNFGSNNVQHVRRPEIAMAWDDPTSPYSAGATRFVLEGQFGYPVTPLRSRTIGSTDLSAFDVLILPDGGYGRVFGDGEKEKLTRWVEAGGTLIGIGSALGYLIEAELLSSKRESQAEREDDPKKDTEEDEDAPHAMLLETEADYLKAIEPKKEAPDSVAGVMVKAILDPEHWLNGGMGESVFALVRGRAIYTPLTLDDGRNPAVIAGPDELLASGYLWEDNRKQMAYKPIAMVEPRGRGLVIGFAADPNFRAYVDGMNVMFLNAVFRGPARARPPVPR